MRRGACRIATALAAATLVVSHIWNKFPSWGPRKEFDRSESYESSRLGLSLQRPPGSLRKSWGATQEASQGAWNRLRGGARQQLPSDDSDSDEDYKSTWIYQHTADRPFLCEINPDWIRDTFNLYGLQHKVPHYEMCLRRILDYDIGFDKLPAKRAAEVEQCCEALYGMIHVRYIKCPEGLERMRQKYERGDFGVCPRALCSGYRLLPVGMTDQIRLRPVKGYCPNCKDIYHIRVRHASTIDGAYYGRSFPHCFLLRYPHLQPKSQPVQFTPTLFGFDVKYPELPTADEYAQAEAEKAERERRAKEEKEQAEHEKREEEARVEAEKALEHGPPDNPPAVAVPDKNGEDIPMTA